MTARSPDRAAQGDQCAYAAEIIGVLISAALLYFCFPKVQPGEEAAR